MREKTAYIVVGGGMRSAHGAGFLYALGTHLHLADPDIIIGTSGNAGNVLYFVARQYDSLERTWTKRLSTPRFISFWRFWEVMNIDYLVDEVFKKQEPLETDTLARTKIRWLIPVTDADTGATVYMNAKSGLDPYELLRAAKATPVYFGKRIMHEGHRYFDGEFGPTLADHVERARLEGAHTVLIIDNESRRPLVHRLMIMCYALVLPRGARRAVMRDMCTTNRRVIAEGLRIFHVRSPMQDVSALAHDRDTLAHTFELGIRDALENEAELRTLLS